MSNMVLSLQYHLVGILLVMNSGVSLAQNSISTIPSTTTSIFATNYVNLIVRAKFDKASINTCLWRHNGRDTLSFVTFLPGHICIPLGTSTESISCADDGTYITSSLTLLQPLSAGNINVSIVCDTYTTLLTLPTITVQDCPSTLPSNITVKASSYIYNAQGTFKCSNNGELFYSNGTRPSSNDTTCLASATWSGQDNLQCWSAPRDVMVMVASSITGATLSIIQNDSLTFTCNYTDTTPIGTETIFYARGASYVIPKNEAFVLTSLHPSDSNTTVSCQAKTPFTQMFNETGISLNNIALKAILSTCKGSDAQNGNTVCLFNQGQASANFIEGENIDVFNCPDSYCNSPGVATCTANGWEVGPSCILGADCINDGDIAIIVIFSLLILICMGYNAWYVFAYTRDHPDEWRVQDKAALITALVGLASFLGLLIGYSANYQHKASCYSSGEYHILTSRDLSEIIAGCLMFYLGCYIIMLILYRKHKSGMMAVATARRYSVQLLSFYK